MIPLRFGGALEMRGPGNAREHPHQQRDGYAVAGVVGETDRQEAEHQRSRLMPEPAVLMQQVQDGNDDNQQQFHWIESKKPTGAFYKWSTASSSSSCYSSH